MYCLSPIKINLVFLSISQIENVSAILMINDPEPKLVRNLAIKDGPYL